MLFVFLDLYGALQCAEAVCGKREHLVFARVYGYGGYEADVFRQAFYYIVGVGHASGEQDGVDLPFEHHCRAAIAVIHLAME